LTYEEILTAKVKERDMVLHSRLHIGDQRQDMRDSYLARIAGINATIAYSACAFYNTEVFA